MKECCSKEETGDPLKADDCNFYKVEKWTEDGSQVDGLLCAGSDLNEREDAAVKHRRAPD